MDHLANNCQHQYVADAQSIDAFVRDHSDALIIFSAGNNNPDIYPPSTTRNLPLRPIIVSQAAANNCFTVGASGSTRTTGIDTSSGLSTLDPDKVYPKRSHGSSKEARIKPHVVAPGFTNFSAQSRHPKIKYRGFRVVNKETSGVVAWQIRSGTSHATLLAVGCTSKRKYPDRRH